MKNRLDDKFMIIKTRVEIMQKFIFKKRQIEKSLLNNSKMSTIMFKKRNRKSRRTIITKMHIKKSLKNIFRSNENVFNKRKKMNDNFDFEKRQNSNAIIRAIFDVNNNNLNVNNQIDQNSKIIEISISFFA